MWKRPVKGIYQVALLSTCYVTWLLIQTVSLCLIGLDRTMTATIMAVTETFYMERKYTLPSPENSIRNIDNERNRGVDMCSPLCSKMSQKPGKSIRGNWYIPPSARDPACPPSFLVPPKLAGL